MAENEKLNPDAIYAGNADPANRRSNRLSYA
jgi:hypothetical protein